MKSVTLTTSIKDQPTIKNKILDTDQKLAPGLLLSLILWLMLWVGYNIGIERAISPGFPHSTLDLIHRVRAFLPLSSAYLAIILLLGRHPLSIRLFRGPLGLLALYTIFGITSSILSREPFTALSWAILYGAVLIVVWAISVGSNSLSRLSSVINLNWAIVAVVGVSLLVFFLFQPGVISSLIAGNFPVGRPYGELAGEEKEIMGMPGTRPTGLGRYAGVVAIVFLARLLFPKKRSKSLWFFLFLFFLFLLIFSQARTAILAFLAGGLLILWLKTRSKLLLTFGIIFGLFLLGLTGFYQAFYTYLIEKMPFVFTLSGRTIGVWPEAWQFFLSSPFLGWGFHADRIFLEGQHIHNAVLHALVQTGLIGTIFFVSAFIWAWIILFRLLKQPRFQKTEKPRLIEIAGVLAFFTVRSITESTGAFFGADWILLAPLLAYITILNQRNFYFKSVKGQYIKKKEVA
ncbi:MAG: O-antigen ligase family protein [Candidatus Nealsonbacteria bacterium]